MISQKTNQMNAIIMFARFFLSLLLWMPSSLVVVGYDESHSIYPNSWEGFANDANDKVTATRVLVSSRTSRFQQDHYFEEEDRIRVEEALSWTRQYRTSYPLLSPCDFTLEDIRSCTLSANPNITCNAYANSISDITNATCNVELDLIYALTNVGSSTRVQSIVASIHESRPWDTLALLNSKDWISTGDSILARHTRNINICNFFAQPMDVQVQVFCSNHAASNVQNDTLPLTPSFPSPTCGTNFHLSCSSSNGGDCVPFRLDNILSWNVSNDGPNVAFLLDQITIFVAHDVPIYIHLNSTSLEQNQTIIGSTNKYSSMYADEIVAVLEYRTLPVRNRISCTIQATWKPTEVITSIPTHSPVPPTPSPQKSLKGKVTKEPICKHSPKWKKSSKAMKGMISHSPAQWKCPKLKFGKSKSPSLKPPSVKGMKSKSPSAWRLPTSSKSSSSSMKSVKSKSKKPPAVSTPMPSPEASSVKGMKSQSPTAWRLPTSLKPSSSMKSVKSKSKKPPAVSTPMPSPEASSVKGMKSQSPSEWRLPTSSFKSSSSNKSVKSKSKPPAVSIPMPSPEASSVKRIKSQSPSEWRLPTSFKSSSSSMKTVKPKSKPSAVSTPMPSSIKGKKTWSPSAWRLPTSSFKSSSSSSSSSIKSFKMHISSPMPLSTIRASSVKGIQKGSKETSIARKSKRVTVNPSTLSRSPVGNKTESNETRAKKSLKVSTDLNYKKLNPKKTTGSTH